MISEVDIRDWDQVDFKKINEVLENGTYLNERGYMWDFIEQVELLRDKQIKAASKQIPALFKHFVDAVNRGE